MIVTRSMHPTFLSNGYLVADAANGHAMVIDTGGPIEPLLESVERHALTVTHVLNTHEHHDHTIHNVELQERFGAPLVLPDELEHGQVLQSGGLRVTALSTPGHIEPHFSFAVDDQAVFTGDALFAGSVGGTMGGGPDGFRLLRDSIMDVLMALPGSMVVYPGHTDFTTIGEEWESNPFVRLWRGLDDEGTEVVEVTGRPAQLVLWARDYDGGHKAWVRFEDGHDAIVGGGMVEQVAAR